MKKVAYLAAALFALPLSSMSGVALAQQGGALAQLVLDPCAGPARTGCVPAVQSAVDTLPRGDQRDTEIVTMVAALAAEARNPSVPKDICLDIAAGISLAGTAMTLAGDAAVIQTLADSLCVNSIETAAIPDQEPPRSLIENNPNATPPVVVPPPEKPVEPPIETPPTETLPERNT